MVLHLCILTALDFTGSFKKTNNKKIKFMDSNFSKLTEKLESPGTEVNQKTNQIEKKKSENV